MSRTNRVDRVDRGRRSFARRGAFAAAWVAAGFASGAPGADIVFAESGLWIESGGARHFFRVELAETPAQQARGLMFRDRLAADAGMLFVYDTPRHVSMWMKNTLVPLDMLFLAADGAIVRIARWATPLSRETIPSGAPVTAVLELAGGAADRLGLAPGDRVRHPVFAPSGR